MDPLTASFTLATIVQLLCCFRQERAALQTADLNDFLAWLQHHKFEQIREDIQSSTNLQFELQGLLKRDVEEIKDKLDVINDSIALLAAKLDGLEGIAAELGFSSNDLSDQAISILQSFEASGAIQLGVFLDVDKPMCALFPIPSEGGQINLEDHRFLADDIDMLRRFTFINLVDHTSSGAPLYGLTRLGARYAKATRTVS